MQRDYIKNYENQSITSDLDSNTALFREIFAKDDILRVRYIDPGGDIRAKCVLLFMDGMVNISLLDNSIVRPLVMAKEVRGSENAADFIAERILFSAEVTKSGDLYALLRGLLYGDSVLLVEGCDSALIANTKGWRTRGISEPSDERVLRGPREGFDEAAMFSVAMLRRKLQTPDLCVEMVRLGRRSDTNCFICYLGSLASPRIVRELKHRIEKLDMDGVLDVNYIAECIRDHPHSLFKTTGTTERPDIVAAGLLEGRVALILDGTPSVMTLPYLFSENFQSDDDYYLNYAQAAVGRILRYLCFFLSILIPGFYLALTYHNSFLLPTPLAISITAARAGVPFSSTVECLLLILVFEILKETGLRMPQGVGHALSIVGGLVIGQAAVEARLVSAPMLIVVAFSGIAGLMIPRLTGAVTYLRLFIVIMARLAGCTGCITAMLIIAAQLLTMESFGVDYTGDLLELDLQGQKDIFMRAPWWTMRRRPFFNHNKIRRGGGR
ncbi:MAG: spore germination protein [Clostridia bacterium]|nr:spore germination protein [Clostridia bacterium]